MTGNSRWPQIEALYRADFARFVRVARAIAGDQEVALEAVQEGFADALRNAGQWNGHGSLEGWVWSCVVNRARKARRRPITETWSDNHDNGSDDQWPLQYSFHGLHLCRTILSHRSR